MVPFMVVCQRASETALRQSFDRPKFARIEHGSQSRGRMPEFGAVLLQRGRVAIVRVNALSQLAVRNLPPYTFYL